MDNAMSEYITKIEPTEFEETIIQLNEGQKVIIMPHDPEATDTAIFESINSRLKEQGMEVIAVIANTV